MTIKASFRYAKELKDTGIEMLSEILISSYPMDTPRMRETLSLQPDSLYIPSNYYTYSGFRDYYRMPLVYPYSLNAIDAQERAYIADETEIDIVKEGNLANQYLHGISHFIFDSNTFYAVIQGHSNLEVSYAILHFKTGEIEKFSNEEKAKAVAEKLGLATDKKLFAIREYYVSFQYKE